MWAVLLLMQAAGDPTIVVSGTQRSDAEVRDEAKAFVRALGAPGGGPDQLGRWNQPICPKMLGGSAALRARLLDRVRTVAAEAAVKQAKVPCKPNILIAFTADAAGTTRKVLARRPWAARSLSVPERRDLATGTYPVRWWYDYRIEGREGDPVVGDSPLLGAIPQNEFSEGNVAAYSSGIVGTRTRRSLGAATIVIDRDAVMATPVDALASYVAMMALAPTRLPPRAAGVPTVMNLFASDDPLRHPGLSAWDRAYLAALYDTAADRSARVQRASITAHVARAMGHED